MTASISSLSPLGVSRILGTLVKRGSLRMNRNGFRPQLPLADVLVAVNARSEPLLGIVEVEALQPLQPDKAVELRHGVGIALRRGGVVAGGEGVAGIETDREFPWIFRAVDNCSQFLEGPPQVGPLPGGGLDQYLPVELRHFAEELVKGRNYPCQAGLRRDQPGATRDA